MSSSSKREMIQVSLGPTANAVTAHALNLQGLAATDGHSSPFEQGQTATCHAETTHTLEKNHWVPRVLLVDEAHALPSPELTTQHVEAFEQVSAFHVQPMAFDSLIMGQPFVTDPFSQPGPSYFQTASTLAYSSHSRYYQEPSSQVTYSVSAENSRHVCWDDDEEEEGEEDPREKQERARREQTNWYRNTLEPLQQQLDTMAPDPATLKWSHWTQFFMPPYSESSKLSLPYSSQSQLRPHWDSYHQESQGEWKEYVEDVLFEQIRQMLEKCDGFQGISITSQGQGIYARLATEILQEIQAEANHAIRLVFDITNPIPNSPYDQESGNPNQEDHSPWQPAHVQRVRTKMSAGLALYDFSQHANAVVPLALPAGDSLFERSAELAMALDAATLPMRLRETPNPRAKIGLLNAPFFGQGASDSDWGSTVPSLKMAEFLTCLQPSDGYKLLGLDTLSNASLTNEVLWQSLRQGTTVERDLRMRQRSTRQRDVPPGNWLQDTKHGGLLSSLSPNVKSADRSVHHHFALSTAIRPVLKDEMGNYLTSLVQGMGIQYRPERSMSTVVAQTLGQLTQTLGYGAGAYWKNLVHVDQPVLSVLANSTRSYTHLHEVSTNMKLVMGSRYTGYYTRDVMNGVLPELEDCQESLEGCLDMRDLYHPPSGSVACGISHFLRLA
eukprot:Nitzschia sp. Nitz4//scaffold98_size77359//29701//32127//NITZ4_005547-RA/size77359-snap-gene-0.10-mRNA-1//-1//CDS//3329560754//659//frame0